MWSTLLSLAPTLLQTVGSIFSGNAASNQKVTTTSEVDYQKLVSSAEAAGINPLTALRNGGSAGFSTQTTHPALSSVSAVGEGLQALGGGLAAYQQDWQAQQRAATEYQLMQAQIANLQADTQRAWESQSFNVPTAQGASSVKTDGGWTVGEPAPVVPIRAAGVSTVPNVGWSNAQDFEDRYGDVAGSVYGVASFGADVVNSIPKWWDDLGRWANERSGVLSAQWAKQGAAGW